MPSCRRLPEDDGESGLDKRCRGAADDCMDDDDDDGGESGGEYYYMSDDRDEEEAEEAKDEEEEEEVCVRDQRYTVLTEDDIRARQEAETAKVAEVLSIPPGFAAVLLRHLKWRPGRVQEEWFSDDRRIRDAVGLPAHGAPVPMALSTRRLTCAICFSRLAAGRTRSAGCAHYYCDECWRGYVGAAVGDGGARCLSLRCPDPSCPAAVVRELVAAVAGRADGARYARFALRSYVVESGGRIRWCPAPGCARAVEFVGCADDCPDVFCACKHGFCFRCGREAHRPVSCETVRAWLLKNVSDGENANWLLAHTKHGPNCRRPIEKSYGCNHMACTCGHHFCWICLDPAGRDHYSCDGYRAPRYKDDDAGAGGKAPTAEEARRRQARASLDRYIFHYERWAANRTSLKKALADMDELKSSWLENMAAALDVQVTELDFLTRAYEQIVGCRRVLRWAYAYGYYLDPERDAGKRALFDLLQKDANQYLELLHGAAEQERVELCAAEGGAAMNEMYRAYKKRVLGLTRVTRRYFGNLVKAFETDLPEFSAVK